MLGWFEQPASFSFSVQRECGDSYITTGVVGCICFDAMHRGSPAEAKTDSSEAKNVNR